MPFFLAGMALMAFGGLLVWRGYRLVSHGEWLAIGCAAFGAALSVLPYLLDHRATVKLMQINALGSIADKLEGLEKFTEQISAATGRWDAVQESVGDQAEKTAAGAKQIADKMATEVREFSEFMQKMNDSEKAALRLEVEKFRRGEAEWLQLLVRIFDHIFALHAAAARSGQPKLAEQITQFQNACRGTVRRIGLTPFLAEPGEPSTPNGIRLPRRKKSRRPTRWLPKPSAPATRFKANCCARPSCACARQVRRRRDRHRKTTLNRREENARGELPLGRRIKF